VKNVFLLIILAASIDSCTHGNQGLSYINADNQDFAQDMRDTNAIIIDVRTPEEFQAGHIPHAVLINFYESNFSQRLDSFNKSKIYLVYCAKGGRSAEAASIMVKKGFKNVVNLQDGFSSWNGSTEK
jgi:rhodanese-related sulfurtransferase